MRFITIMLAVFVLGLALKPGLDMISLHIDFEESCCGSNCAPIADFDHVKDPKPADGCDGNGCNPFQVCCSSMVFLLATPFNFSVHSKITTKRIFTYQSAYTLLIAHDFWQPPQFV